MNKAVCFIISVTTVALCAMAEDINPNAIENPAPSILSALEVMRLLPPDDHRYLKAALVCACGAKMQQLPDETIYYLSLAAASQILRADRDGTVLHQLGKMLFDRGDIDRSHRYLAVALENVPYSGVTGRNSQVVQSLSIIDSSYHEKLQSYTRMQYLFITFISLVIVASAVVFFLFRHSRQRRRSDNRALLLARQDIATYLRKFLELSTLSSRRLSQFCRMASRKLSANQIDSLYDIVRSGRMIEELRRDSFTLFDETFLSVYPDFVTNLNRLLLPDEHYSLQESHRLPPELRIYAFISLGITDNNVIADYCSYSLNTVYAYRAKVKSKAINRDTFDYDFLTTGTV